MQTMLVLLPLLAHLVAVSESADLTCADVKTAYVAASCCGMPSNTVSDLMTAASCPFDFTKPSCETAGVQAPRNVSTNSIGLKAAAFSPITAAQASKLAQTNIHFHLGAEHYSQGEYMHAAHSSDDHRRLSSEATAGWMCDSSSYNVTSYDFQYCEGMEVGKTYEVHYVWSSAALALMDDMTDAILTDGLGQAANGRSLLNPFIRVQAQVFVIVNEDGYEMEDMVHGMNTTLAKKGADEGLPAVMYAGSTTGTSHNDEVCSPFAITWHVDRKCQPVSAKSWDKMCKDMIETYGMTADLEPHSSRTLVDSSFVVPWDEVSTLDL